MDMGRKGIELLQELKRDTQLPPYDVCVCVCMHTCVFLCVGGAVACWQDTLSWGVLLSLLVQEEALAHVAREIDTLNTDMELTAQLSAACGALEIPGHRKPPSLHAHLV